MEGKLHINTTAVHGGGRKDDCFGAINEPIYMTSNYRIPTDGTPVDWSGIHSNIYQRNRNPNQMVLQDKLCALTGAEDGAVFAGTSCGAPGEAFGEICFNTSLEGYLEIATDPSYAGQIVVLTYPQVGNYGVNADDAQAQHPALRALVVRDLCPTPSSWRSQESLGDYLTREGVVANVLATCG